MKKGKEEENDGYKIDNKEENSKENVKIKEDKRRRGINKIKIR